MEIFSTTTNVGPAERDAANETTEGKTMTVFSGVDIVFARPVPARDLERGVSALLGVPSSRVVVVAGVADYPAMESADVVCVSTAVEGDFTHLVSIHLQPRELRDHTNVSFAQSLAEALSVPCIVPDEGPNPCSVILIEPGEPPEPVRLDDEALDEDRYVLAR
jgi:hypothetical protein